MYGMAFPIRNFHTQGNGDDESTRGQTENEDKEGIDSILAGQQDPQDKHTKAQAQSVFQGNILRSGGGKCAGSWQLNFNNLLT